MVSRTVQPNSAVSAQNDFPGRTAKPFLKWAGGKQQLLTQFEAFFPDRFSRYIEPFAGGAAVYFYLWNGKRLPGKNYLFDNNEELINAYRTVRDNVEELMELLSFHDKSHSREHFYSVRGMDRSGVPLTGVERAARAIYLNRTCYNGLYRVNGKGQFNVPMGRYLNPRILNREILARASGALQGVCIEVADFRGMTKIAKHGDFFYFDPPYHPLSKTSSFTGYTADNFMEGDQADLARVYDTLTQKGCFCMLSNSDTPLNRKLYGKYRIEIVRAKRAINANGNGRGEVAEVVVLNY